MLHIVITKPAWGRGVCFGKTQDGGQRWRNSFGNLLIHFVAESQMKTIPLSCLYVEYVAGASNQLPYHKDWSGNSLFFCLIHAKSVKMSWLRLGRQLAETPESYCSWQRIIPAHNTPPHFLN